MPKSVYENWIRGPWTNEERSFIGKLALRLVTSRAWEYLFLMFIVFMAGIKTTEHREQAQGRPGSAVRTGRRLEEVSVEVNGRKLEGL